MKILAKMASSKKGFTLTEVMIAMSILTVAIVSATNLLISLMNSNRVNVTTLQAYFLAQEGLEIARNIRDTNWLQGNKWDVYNEFVSLNGAEVGLELKDSFSSDPWQSSGSAAVIKLGAVEFNRTLSFEEFCSEEELIVESCSKTKVTARVFWDDSGKESEVNLSTVLTDWQKDE